MIKVFKVNINIMKFISKNETENLRYELINQVANLQKILSDELQKLINHNIYLNNYYVNNIPGNILKLIEDLENIKLIDKIDISLNKLLKINNMNNYNVILNLITQLIEKSLDQLKSINKIKTSKLELQEEISIQEMKILEQLDFIILFIEENNKQLQLQLQLQSQFNTESTIKINSFNINSIQCLNQLNQIKNDIEKIESNFNQYNQQTIEKVQYFLDQILNEKEKQQQISNAILEIQNEKEKQQQHISNTILEIQNKILEKKQQENQYSEKQVDYIINTAQEMSGLNTIIVSIKRNENKLNQILKEINETKKITNSFLLKNYLINELNQILPNWIKIDKQIKTVITTNFNIEASKLLKNLPKSSRLLKLVEFQIQQKINTIYIQCNDAIKNIKQHIEDLKLQKQDKEQKREKIEQEMVEIYNNENNNKKIEQSPKIQTKKINSDKTFNPVIQALLKTDQINNENEKVTILKGKKNLNEEEIKLIKKYNNITNKSTNKPTFEYNIY